MQHSNPSDSPPNSRKSKGISAKPKDGVAFHALSMAFGTMTSRVLGLVRDMAFAAMFSRTVTDAWNVAFRLPNMFRRLLGEGSLSVSFIPVFVDARVQDPSGERARNLVNGFYTMLLVVLGVLTTLGIIFAEPVIRLLVEDNFDAIPGKFDLTVHMAQIMFGFIFLMSTYAYLMGILNALGSFALPAMAPTFFNIAMIIANFIPLGWQKIPGEALAWGVIVGGFLQTGALVPSLIKKGYFPKIRWRGLSSDILRVWRNMLPGMLGMGLLQITTIVNTNFASRLGEGSNTYIYLADRLLELPLSLVSVSLGTALLPTLAGLWSKGAKDNMVETANYYLRLNLLIAIPAALGLYFLSMPIVQLLFERGQFLTDDSMVTASVVQIYSLTLIVSSSVRVVVPSYYAIKNTWLPAVISAACLLLHILIAPILMGQFGIRGLVISTLLSAGLNLCTLMAFYPFFIGKFHFGKMFFSIGRYCLAGVGLILVCLCYEPIFHFFLNALSFGVFFSRLISVILVISVSAVVYVLSCYFLKVDEIHHIFDSIKRRFN